ncbi:MAG TPA: hypothetical protein VG474_12715 [Solirubrobacteraceae bacterium]|nr:hypothetical protein [Solirubrobacteraceae bacterium]
MLTVFALRAGQELNGLPRWTDDRRARRIGRGFLRVSPTRLRLQPGEARAVRARVLAPRPARGRGSYGVLVFAARQPGREARGDAVLSTSVRLTANLLLRYPGRVRHRSQLEQLRAEQAGPRVLRFFARVHNRGNLHVQPSARMVIRNARGRVVARLGFVSGNVLPRARRDLPAELSKVLPAGRYTALATARSPGQTMRRRLAFRLVGPNELPTPKLQVDELAAPRPGVGDDFEASVGLINRGTAPARPRGVMTVSRMSGAPLARRSLRLAALAPGGRASVSVTFDGLAEGQYRLAVRIAGPGGVADERTVVFSPGAKASLWERLRDWGAAHVGLLIAGFAGVLLAIVAAGAAYVRRLRRSLAEQPAA